MLITGQWQVIIIVVRLFLPLSYMYTHLPRFSRSGPCSAILVLVKVRTRV